MPLFIETIVALATPTGTSAIAVIRVSGSDTPRLMQEIFGSLPSPRSVTRMDYRERDGELLDDVLITFFQAPRSYTGEDLLEISCHGNPLIAHKVLEDLMARGCRAALPGEFTQRAYLNERMDLSQAEGVMDLIQARSERALRVANQQLRGALGRKMEPLSAQLLQVIARVEAYIDFPEEDLPGEDSATLASQLRAIAESTSQLLATSRYGELLRNGVKTVIVGEPNSGKSSLMNRLLGRERALVSPEPGTTRDFIEERLLIEGHSVQLIDTAGLNSTPTEVESMGIARTYERAEEADLIIHVMDVTCPALPLPAAMAAITARVPSIVVFNKTDLLLQTSAVSSNRDRDHVLYVSALTNAGIPELRARIAQQVEFLQPRLGGDEIIAVSARHANALTCAQDALKRATLKLASKAPAELLASDLREVLESYGEILGKIDNEKMLDELFRSFCIGK